MNVPWPKHCAWIGCSLGHIFFFFFETVISGTSAQKVKLTKHCVCTASLTSVSSATTQAFNSSTDRNHDFWGSPSLLLDNPFCTLAKARSHWATICLYLLTTWQVFSPWPREPGCSFVLTVNMKLPWIISADVDYSPRLPNMLHFILMSFV